MAQPTSYTRRFNFTQFSTTSPSAQQPGTYLDAEFNAIKVTSDQTLANLKLIQRDDGMLANLSVGFDQLKSEVTNGLNPVTPWTTLTNYVVNQFVAVNSIQVYRCLVAHTSGTFASDLAGGKWTLVLDISGPLATVGSFTTGTFTGTGAQTVYDLGASIINAARVIWVEAGVVKTPGVDYTISGTQLTRTSAPGNGVAISWRLLGSASYTSALDNSVGTTALVNGAVTTAKLGDLSVATAKLVDQSVTNAKLAFDQGVISRNRLINGDFAIDQWNGGNAVLGLGVSARVADRWLHSGTQPSKFNSQVFSAFANSPNITSATYLRLTSTSAFTPASTDFIRLSQVIEGVNIADLAWGTANARPAVLSFYVAISASGTYSVAISNGAGDRSYVANFTVTGGVKQKVILTIPGDTTGTWPTDGSAALRVSFNLGAGSNFATTAGSWTAGNFLKGTGTADPCATNALTYDLTDIQFEPGSVATPYERKIYSEALRNCQRFYVPSVYVVFSGNVTSGGGYVAAGILPVQMRASPSGVFSASQGAAGFPNVVGTFSAINSYTITEQRTANATGVATFSSIFNLTAELN